MKWTLYYDGGCGLCTRTIGWLSRLDLFGSVVWVPSQSLSEPPEGLSFKDLERSTYLETGNGRLHEGFYAIRMLTLRLLPLMPLAPLLWLPGMHFLGVPVYRWVARNRRSTSCIPTA